MLLVRQPLTESSGENVGCCRFLVTSHGFCSLVLLMAMSYFSSTFVLPRRNYICVRNKVGKTCGRGLQGRDKGVFKKNAPIDWLACKSRTVVLLHTILFS